MFFDYKFWKYLTHPNELADTLQTSTMNGFKKRVLFVFLTGALLYAIRDIWGMNTESMTSLLSTMSTTDYTIARYSSLVGMIIWALVYMSFHFFGFAYLLSLITPIPFKKLLPLQLLVIGILLIEKALVVLVFTLKGAAANMSFLSFGPLAMTFLENSYLIFFLNQLTVTSALIIALQFKFIRSYTGMKKWKGLLALIIAIHVVLALITAAIGFITIEDFLRSIVGGVMYG